MSIDHLIELTDYQGHRLNPLHLLLGPVGSDGGRERECVKGDTRHFFNSWLCLCTESNAISAFYTLFGPAELQEQGREGDRNACP